MKTFLLQSIILTILAGMLMYDVVHADATEDPPSGSGTLQLETVSPHRFTAAFLDSDKYTGHFRFSIDPADIGKQAELFLAARHLENWYLRSPLGWKIWDASLATITSFQTVELERETLYELFRDADLLEGDYDIYAAYQTAGGDLVVSSTVMEFEIKSSQKDSLHKFISDTAMDNFLKEGMLFSSSDLIFLRADDAVASVTEGSNSLSTASSQISSTNVQVAGVDEADTIKSDGESLYVLRNCGGESCVATFSLNATQASSEEVGVFHPGKDELPLAAESMYLVKGNNQAEDKLVTLSGQNSSIAWRDVWSWGGNKLELEFLNASVPAKLSLSNRLSIDGSLISSRRIGDMLYLVTRYSPSVPGFIPYAYDDEARQRNDVLLAESTLLEMTPKITFLSGAKQELVSSEQCYLATGAVDATRNPSIISIVSIPLNAPESFSSTCFLGNSETVYMTTDSLYLATTQNEYSVSANDALFYNPNHKTAIHKFALRGSDIEYRGSGEVEGHLGWSEDKRSFRMGANGKEGEYLNVVTSLGDTWSGSSSTRLTVLKENAGELQTIDIIDGIGKPGEQLYAARFLGDRAYLVTFRVIDPLYVIDLSDQDNPSIAGELEIDGYSDYLHPIGESLILGIGKDAIPDDGSTDFSFTRGAWYQGVKLSLFDVSDISAPTEINSLIYGKRGSDSEVLYDHHGISFLSATDTSPARFSIPIQIHATEPDSPQFDPKKPNAFYSFTNKGLYSFEATMSGLSEAGYIEADSTSRLDSFNFWGPFPDRSLLVNDSVFYVHQGEVKSSAWGFSDP